MDFLIKLGFYILYGMILFVSVTSVIRGMNGFKKIKTLDSHFRMKYLIHSILLLFTGIIVLLLAILFLPLFFLLPSFLKDLTLVGTLFGIFYFVLASSTPIILMVCFPCLAVTGFTLNKMNKKQLQEKKNIVFSIANFCSVFLTCVLLVFILFATLKL